MTGDRENPTDAPKGKAPAKRSRTVTWTDPAAASIGVSALDGMTYLRSIRDGEIPPPPVAGLVGYRIRAVENGRAVFELEPAEFHYNPFATVHGGIAGLLLDTAMTSAVISTLPADMLCSTLEFKVNFIRPMTAATGTVQCLGEIIHAGKRMATAQGRITDAAGRLYAHGTGTCKIFKKR